MLIRFKNKMTMGLMKMIEQGEKLGGIPTHVEVSVEEAQAIIAEINTLRKEALSTARLDRYKFVMANDTDARLSFTSRELSEDEAFGLLTQWTRGEIAVAFEGIPLLVKIDVDKKYHD